MPSLNHFRAFARRPTSLSAAIQCEELGINLPAELQNLGLGGAAAIALEPLPIGARVRLRIDAPQLWEPLTMSGRVVWTHPAPLGRSRLGLCFEGESAGTLLVLAELIGPGGQL